MTTPKEALEAARNALVALRVRLNAEPAVQGRGWVSLGIVLNDAVEKADEALASLQGEDAVEKVARGVNRIWFDTEFIEDGKTIDLISIGMVRSDGATYYAETDQWIPGKASQWVKDNVLVHLKGGDAVKPRDVIAREIVEFAGEKPEFWAYYADYDWVALCQLFGTMMQLPDGWPMFCRDIKQWCVDLGNPKLPEQSGVEHHALADALWNKQAWKFLATGLVPDEAAIRADNTANLISIIADIREKTGLGGKPMLNELADAIVAEMDRRVADEREKQRERDAEIADCIGDKYDATSFMSPNAEQVAALRSKEQAAHDIAAAIRAGGGE